MCPCVTSFVGLAKRPARRARAPERRGARASAMRASARARATPASTSRARVRARGAAARCARGDGGRDDGGGVRVARDVAERARAARTRERRARSRGERWVRARATAGGDARARYEISTSWDDYDDEADDKDEGSDEALDDGEAEEEESAAAIVAVDVVASPESVWACLARGENLSEFVPTLLVAKRGPKQYGSTETEVRLLAMDYTLFTPRMLNTVSVRIVDKSKGPPNWENGPAKLGFLARNVDERSDFMLVGSFCIRPIFGESYKCRLEYRAELRPTNYEVPAAVLRRAVEESFPFVIASVTKQAVKRDQRRLRSPGFLPQLETPFGASRELAKKADDSLVPSGYLGLSEVNVPTQNSGSSEDEETPDATKAAAVRMRPRGDTAKASEAPKSWRAIGGGAQGEKWFSSDITPFENPGSLEVHMRRYDTDSLLHRRALAAVRIEAPPALVWDLLTNYENMPKFMPHLMHTEYIQRYNAVEREASETIKRLRLRQVFVKCELFHAIEESTAMDVVQKDDRTELQFRVLQNPKFGALQGKWLVVPTEDSAATVLKFAIEGVVSNPGTDGTAKKVDPLNERIVFEEISTMLKQARDFMEGIASKEVQSYGNINIKVADLVLKGAGMSVDEEDAVDEQIVGALDSEATDNQDEQIQALKRELTTLGFGENKCMPTREQLRGGRHWDAIQQIESLGGFVKVAQLLDWSGAKTRPRGYWTLRTLELEIKDFIANTEDRNVRRNPRRMPSQKSLRDAGRSDIVNALKRFGGAEKVAASMGLEFGTNKRSSASARGGGGD